MNIISRNIILIALGVTSLINGLQAADAVIPESKRIMIEQVRSWVAQTKQVDPNEININAMDRRLMVPTCAAPFTVSLPFPDQRTVRVACESSGWTVLLGVEINQQPFVLRFQRDMARGEQLAAGDVDTLSANDEDRRLLAALEDRILKVNVHRGQLVDEQLFDHVVMVYVTTRDLREGDTPGAADIRRVERAAGEFSAAARLSAGDITSAALARDLPAGAVIDSRELLSRYQVRVADKLIPRGESIGMDNTRTVVRYGKMPADALPLDIARLRIIATGQIKPGEMIQMSQLRLLPEIVKGDRVTLTLTRGRMLITALLTAVEDGKLGNEVQLRNEESGNLVTAVVTGQKKAILQ